MKVLLVKTSSLGDLIHSFPALNDAVTAIPGLSFDWVVEEAFTEVPSWSRHVDKVIPIALRRWRKSPWQTWRSGEWRAFVHNLQAREYDLVIDAQGLLKSALTARKALGVKAGLDQDSAREPFASFFYRRRLPVPKGAHAISRVRRLFALALGYSVPEGEPEDYGMQREKFPTPQISQPFVLFLHGTTWRSKHYPEAQWFALARLAVQSGVDVLIPWGNDTEHARADRIAASGNSVRILPKQSLTELAGLIANARGIIAVDTGLAHLASAFQTPQVVLFGPTQPELTGVLGANQKNLQAAGDCVPCMQHQCRHPESSNGEPVCFKELSPEQVWLQLTALMHSENRRHES
jgi:heptosyltransferase-1